MILVAAKKLWNDITDEPFSVEDLPCPSMWHPRDQMRIFGIGENLMQPSGEVISRLLVLVQLTSLLQIAAKILIGVIYKLGHPCRWGRWLDDHDDDDDVDLDY